MSVSVETTSQKQENNVEKLNYIQIQQEEIEVLESIYLHDMKILKSSPPFKFEVICRPFLSNFDDISDTRYNLRITIEYVKNYPERPPLIEFDPLTNISQDNVAEIEMTTQKILDNMNGTPILYELIETARTWIHVNLIDLIETENQKKADESVYVRKNYDTYTPVTKESFLIWKNKFEEEMHNKKMEEQKCMQHLLDEQDKRISGAEFFKQLALKEQESGNKGKEEGKEESVDGEDDEDDVEEYVQENLSEGDNDLDWNCD